ncbi:MAG: HEAT repeat domain-containing protein [Planctomycetota bacterium]
MTKNQTPDEKTESKPDAPGAEKQPPSWQFILGVILLAVWVIALGVYGLDRAFHLGLFPTRLERRLTTYVGQLTSEDPAVRKKAEQGLFSYHGFAVPILIEGLRSGDEEQRAACAQCLMRIAEYYYGAKPDNGIDANKWERWWERIDRWMVEQMDHQADEQQAKRQEWARRQR